MRIFYVYITANRNPRLYTGVTSDFRRRMWQHRAGICDGFTKKYNVTRLVYFECTEDPRAAIAREKRIKGWLRTKKIRLIESVNPEWDDLAQGW